jgi:hypothetical protein
MSGNFTSADMVRFSPTAAGKDPGHPNSASANRIPGTREYGAENRMALPIDPVECVLVRLFGPPQLIRHDCHQLVAVGGGERQRQADVAQAVEDAGSLGGRVRIVDVTPRP